MVKAATVGTLSITSADSFLIHFRIEAVELSRLLGYLSPRWSVGEMGICKFCRSRHPKAM